MGGVEEGSYRSWVVQDGVWGNRWRHGAVSVHAPDENNVDDIIFVRLRQQSVIVDQPRQSLMLARRGISGHESGSAQKSRILADHLASDLTSDDIPEKVSAAFSTTSMMRAWCNWWC
jgi:hypothetical protein